MNKSKSSPEIRFKDFHDDWEQRKLSSLAGKTYGGGTPKTKVAEYWQGTFPWIQSSDLKQDLIYDVTPQKFISKKAIDESATKIVPENSITIVTRVGVGKLALMPYSFATSQDFLSLSYLNVESHFGVYSLYKMLQKEINNIQGTSIKGITKKDLLNKVIYIPENLKEQQKIGSIFKYLDNTIALHQHELTLLKQRKKAFLQKMFPKKGESVPEIRLIGYENTWNSQKLKNIGIATGGTSIESEFNVTGKFKIISIGSYSEESKYRDQGIRTDKTPKTENRILKKNDLTMVLNDKTSSGNIIGRVLLINDDDLYVYNQRTERIQPDLSKYNAQFLYYMFNAPKMRMNIIRKAQGNTQIYVNWSSIQEIEYLVPEDITEQQKIGNFFKQIDDDIILHEQKLEKLKEMKKAFLQKMFV